MDVTTFTEHELTLIRGMRARQRDYLAQEYTDEPRQMHWLRFLKWRVEHGDLRGESDVILPFTQEGMPELAAHILQPCGAPAEPTPQPDPIGYTGDHSTFAEYAAWYKTQASGHAQREDDGA